MHLVQRGNNKAPVFLFPEARELYLNLLGKFARDMECSIHAYVLMTNHVHLLVTQSDEWGVSCLMKRVNERFGRYTNKRLSRCGTLWQGRYWCSLVDDGDYVLNCHRYIEQNPVRANMVERAEDFPWSSHGGNTGRFSRGFLKWHSSMGHAGMGDVARCELYAALTSKPLDDERAAEIRKCLVSGLPFGRREFIDRLRADGARVSIGRAGRPRKDAGKESGYVPDF